MSSQTKYYDLVNARHRLEVFLRWDMKVEFVAARASVCLVDKLIGEMAGIGPDMRVAIDQQSKVSFA